VCVGMGGRAGGKSTETGRSGHVGLWKAGDQCMQLPTQPAVLLPLAAQENNPQAAPPPHTHTSAPLMHLTTSHLCILSAVDATSWFTGSSSTDNT